MSRVLVIGGGVAGLCCATTLAERGAHVTLLERSPELGGNASWLAGGMLAPFCEGESAPQSVVELGQGAIDWWDTRAPGVTREGTLVVAPPRDSGEIDRFATRTKALAPGVVLRSRRPSRSARRVGRPDRAIAGARRRDSVWGGWRSARRRESSH